MRVHSIDHRKLSGDPLPFPTGEFHDPAETIAVFDRLGLPDAFPFVLDDDMAEPMAATTSTNTSSTPGISAPSRWTACVGFTWRVKVPCVFYPQ